MFRYVRKTSGTLLQIISLVSDDHGEVERSLLSVPAQNDGLVLVIPGEPAACVAE